MKISWNRLALLTGVFVLSLMVVDGLVKMNRSAMDSYGVGESPLVAADSAAALFLVGLVAGMVLGIGIFFGCLAWRERRCTAEPDEVARLLEEVAEEEQWDAFLREGSSNEEPIESLDPWERPADWWKRGED